MIDLLDVEQKKAQRNTLKAVGAIKLRVLDDFNRRLLNKDLVDHYDKVQKTAKKLFNLQQQTRREHNEKALDEKIKNIKLHLTREAQIEQQRGMEQLKKDEELAAKRLAELEAKKEEMLRKREADYRVRRDQIVKHVQAKEATEL